MPASFEEKIIKNTDKKLKKLYISKNNTQLIDIPQDEFYSEMVFSLIKGNPIFFCLLTFI